MTEQIDHSALADSRIATQYKESAKFRAFIRALMDQSQELEGVFFDIAAQRDIDLSAGVSLDMIGEIVGVSRIVDDVLLVPFFGFQGVALAQPFGEEGDLFVGGRFLEEGESITGSSVLADPEYRMVIRSKIAKNHSKGTNDDVLAALTYLFGGVHCAVHDSGNMAIDVAIGRSITAVEYALLTELDILPRPAGVRINGIVSYFAEDYFGFDGMPGALGLGEEGDVSVGGRWAEDVSGGLPAYPSISCTFALNAEEAEVVAEGATGRLALSDDAQSFEHTIVAGAAGWVDMAAAPAGFSTGTSQVIDISEGIVGVRLNVLALPTEVATTPGAGIGVVFAKPDLSDPQILLLAAQSDGTALLRAFGAGLPSVDTSFAAAPGWLGVYWNTATGQWGHIADGTDLGYVGSYAGGTERVPLFVVTVPPGTDATFDGFMVRGAFVVAAESMGTGWPAGTTDPCRTEI